MDKHKKPKKIFDVVRPGKTPAQPTSRPVIVGHKPEVHDTMIGGDTAKVGVKEKAPLLNATLKVTIQPSKASEVPEVSEHESPARLAPPPADSAPEPPSLKEASQPSHTHDATPAPAGKFAVGVAVDLPDEPQASTPTPLSDSLLAAAEKEPDNPNPLMQHGPQVSVFHHAGSTSGRVWLVVLLIAVFTLIALNFALDLEIIKTELSLPHTDWL